MAGPWESFKPQAAPPAPVENGPWTQFTANAAPEPNPPEPEPGLLGRAWNTAAGIGQGLYDLPTYAAGTAANLAEGSRPLDAETWADPAAGKSERRQQERLQAPEAQGATLIPGVSRGDINQAFASLPFSVASLGGTLAGGLAGTLTPVPGGAVAGGFAGGLYPAYRADTGMFVRQGLDSFTQKYQEQHGRPPSRDELLQEQERLQPYAREHGLWEAVPEAAGNLVMAPLVKGLLKPGGNLAAKTAKFLAGTTAEELPTETVTQMGQQGVESRAGMNDEAPREFSDPGAWWQSLKEVAPVTVTQSLLMGGAGAGTRFALDRLAARGRAENPAPSAGSETRAPGGLPGLEHPADAFKAAEAAPASGQPAVDSSAASTVPTGIDPATGEVLQGAVSEFSGGLTPANLGQRLPTLAVTAPTDYEETVRKIRALPDGHPLKTALTIHQQAVKQKTQQRQAEQAPIAASIAPLPAAETAEQQRTLKRLEQDRNAAVQRARHFERQARAAEESGDVETALARRQQAGQVRDEFAAKVAAIYQKPAAAPGQAPAGLETAALEQAMRERARAANRPAAVAPAVSAELPQAQNAQALTPAGSAPLASLSPQGEGLKGEFAAPPNGAVPEPKRGEAVSAARPAGALAPDSSVNQPENNDGERQGQGRGRQEVLTPSAGIAPPAEPLSARQQPAAEQPSRNPLPFAPTHVLSDGTPVVPNVDERGKTIPNEWLDRDGGIIEDVYATPIESAGVTGNAQQEQAAGAADGRGGARQGVRGQGGDSAESGAGVQPGGPEDRNPEGQAQGREVTPAPEELRALKTAPPLLSLDKREDSGWRYYESDNAVRLVSRDGKVAREFLNPDTRSGTEMARTRARAHAFALDNPYAGDQGPAPSSENVDPKQTDETVDLPRAPAGAETPAKAAGIAGGLPPDAIPAGVPAAAGSEGGAAGQAAIDAAAQQAATSPVNDKPQPTEAQKKAGNYAKGHIRLHGLDISIENPRGSERSGTDRGGKPWKVRMRHHYGYIKGTVGKDKDHLDVFIGPTPNSPKVYVVDQVDPDTGRFDEHKVLLGFKGLGQAKAGYLGNYAPGWQGLGTITPTSLNEFKTWLTSGNTRQPFAKTQGATDAEHTQRDAAADDRGAEADHPGPGGGEQPPVAAGGGAGSGPGFSDRPGTGSGSDRISGDRETGPDREPEGAAVGGGALGGKADVGVAAAAPPAGKVAADGKPAEAETPKNDDRIEIEGWLDRFRKGNYDFPTMASYQNKKLQDAAEKRLKETRDLYYRAAHEFLEGPLDTPVSGEFGQAKHKVSRLAWGDLEGVHPQPVPKRVGKIRQDLTALRKALMDVHVPKYDVRHYLMGIHMEPENRRMVASNGHTLAVLDNVDLSGLPARPGAETVLNAKDQWVEGKYPDYRKFMPNLRSDDYRTVSAEQIGDYARGIAKANGYLSTTSPSEVVPIGFVAGKVRGTYNPVYVAEALDLLRKLGYTEARIAIGDKAQMGSLAIESPDGRLRQLVMPQNFAQGVFDPVDLDAAEPTRKRARAVQAEPEADRVAFDVDGVKVYPGEFRGEPRWFAQFEGNVGTEKTNGDTIHRSREEAESAARRTAEDIKRKQDIAAKDQEVEAERERKKEENRGKSITERRADALLDSPSRFPASVGLGRGTKREAMQSAVDQGRAITAEHVFDSAAKKKDQETVERARRGGYILGLSNENIPEVKAGLEARDRLKADSYQKLEYRVYEGRKPEGGHYVITKTEYDYAKRLQKENEAETRDEPSKPEEKQGESAAIKGAASTQTEYSAKDEVLENRDPPEVAQPTVVGAATIVVKTLSGPKNIRVKLYELPGYKGPQLAVSHTKLRGKDRFAVYLPKSGVLLEDSNGLSTLEETLKNAVQRVSGARKRAADLEREAKIKTENFDERAARLKEEWTRLAEESKNGLSEIAKTEENVKQPEPEKAPPADPVKSAEEKERAAWHTPIPTEGLEIDPKEQKPSGYELVAPRLAADAHAAITQAQHQAIAASGGQWYLYALPAADGRNGIARLFPDDQTPPAPWRLANNGVGIRLNALTKEQAIAAIVQGLKNAPVIGTPASAPQIKRIAGGAPVEGKPDLGRYVQPKGDGSAQQQRDMASRTGRIAPLIMMNDIVGAYDRDALDQIADDRIDPVREYLRQRYNAAKSFEGQVYAEKPVASEQDGAAAKGKPQEAATGDVGDELSHNRRSRGGKITWGDVEKLNPTLRVKEVTKSKVWPKPDYAELAGDGSDKARQVVAHIVKQVYDSIAAGPVVRTAGEISDEALKQYLDGVSRVMGGVLAWAEDKKAVADWFKVVGARAGAMRGLGASLNLSEMTQASRALMERIYPNRSWQNVDREELRRIGGNKVLAALQPGTDEAIKALKDIEKGWPGKRESWQMQGLEVVPIANAEVKRSGVNRPGMEWLVDLGRRNYVSGLTRNYGSEQEAREKLAEYKPFLLFGKRGFAGDFATEDEAVNRARALAKGRRNSEAGPSEKGTSVMASERVGVERRQPGEDVTSDQLKKTFGFRGINFGNWMKGDANAVERQAHLNHAYDAFMDLAEVLKVPPEALSLDGMLGLAIGAQGSGGWAAAHFVPGVNEINLTREGGAGALAHEFGHALDHYFGVMAGLGATKQPWASELNGLLPSQQPKESALRPELRALWKSLSETITQRVESPAELRARLDAAGERAAKVIERYGSKGKIDPGLLERLKAGELGDGYVKLDPKSRKRYAETVPANAHEAARQLLGPREGKTAGEQYEWDRTAKEIGQAAMGINAYRNELANNLGKGRMLHTRYYQDAVKTQNDTKMKQGGRDYWTQPTEMLARAFETYVQDRLADAGISNTYLVRAGKAQETEETSIYPQGRDRQAINEAFDQLIGEVKTREGEGGLAVMYSRGPATQAAYESRIDDLFAGAKPDKENGVRVLDRSDLLDLLGYGDHEVVLAEQHAVGEGMFNHGLTAADWKKVPEWLDDPVAAFVRNKDGHVTVIAKETKNGVPIVIGLKPQVGVPGRSGKKLHVVLTAYDKSSGKLPLRRMIDEGELAYLNQKATPLFNRGSGHHLPGNVGELRGYKRKIYTERDLVKYRNSHESQSFSRGFDAGGSTREAVREELRAALGKVFEALEKAGLIRIVARQEELPANARGKFHKVWHGSPHDFDEFKLQHIGSGEGAQAYGWGLYFAGAKDIAKFYKDKLSKGFAIVTKNGSKIDNEYINMAMDSLSGDNKEITNSSVKGRLQKYLKGFELRSKAGGNFSKDIEAISSLLNDFSGYRFDTSGRLYEVELAPKEDEYLDWDKPLSEQSKHVQKAFKSGTLKQYRSLFYGDPKGSHIYNIMAEELGMLKEMTGGLEARISSAEAASKAFLAAGIPGIRYKDATARGTEKDSYNYVIFDDSLAKIEGKYARAGGTIRGVFDGKTSWLVAENLAPGSALGTLLHESGVHQFLPELIGSDRLASLGQEFRRLLKSGDPTARAVEAHVHGLLDRKEMNPAHADEERIAYAVEMEARQGAAGMSGRFRMWLGRIKAALRAWFWRSGLGRALAAKGFKLDLTVADLAALARAAVRQGARNHLAGAGKMVGKERPSPLAPLPWGEGDMADAVAQYSKEFGVSADQLRKEFEAVVKRTVGSMAEYDALPAAPGKNGLKAPNGKPSRLNKQQWVMVRTPRFKAWFGDWESAPGKASKVVDANGEPLVVYHGTPQPGFSEFSAETKNSNTGGEPGSREFHFTDNPEYAEAYSGSGAFKMAELYLKKFGSEPKAMERVPSNIVPVFLSIKKPEFVQQSREITALRITSVKRSGKDGVFAEKAGLNASEYVAFDSAQIKSATGNTGAFDASSPDIRHSLTDRLEQARMLGFDTSRRWYHGTPSGNDFRGFDLEKTGQKTGTREEAIYLTDNPDVAGAYAYQEDIFFEPGGGARTEESYGALLPVYTRGRIYDASGEVPKGRYDADLFERLIDTAKEAGYDGIDFGTIRDVPFGTPYGNPEGRIRAMFYPENIRSTHAEFDPGKRQLNDLLFSQGALPGASEAGRAAREFGQSLPGLAKLGRDFKRQFHKLGDSAKTLVLGGLTARMNAELARGVLPMIEQRFLPAMQNQEAVSGQLREYFAEKVAKPFEALLNEDAAMADRTGDLLLEARIAGVDPAREFAHLRKPEEIQGRMKAVRAFMRSAPNDPRMPIWMEELNDLKTAAKHEANRAREFPRLRQQFQALSPKAQTVFRSVLKHQDRMTDLYFAALNRKIANLDLQGKQKAAIIARLRKDREGMRVQGPYVPLSRHGNFWVATQEPGTTEREAPLTISPLENGRIVVKGRELHAQRELLKAMGGRYDGKAEGYVFKATIAARVRKHLADFLVPKDYEIPGQISFDKFETEAEQQEFIKAIEEEGGREVLGSGLNMPKPREMEQVAPDFVVEVDGLLAGLGDDPAVEAVRDALYQNYLERLPEMSSRKHWLHAKKTPGYSHDVLRNLATKTVHDANQIARIRHGGAAREALDEAAEALKVAGTKNSRKMADARLEALTDYLRDGYLLDDARFQSWVSGMGEARRVELEKIRKRYRSDAEAVGAALRRQARVVESAGKIVAGNEQHFAARVIAELEQSYTDAMNPTIHPAALWLNSLGFGMHLAVSPGAALANALQTPITAMPTVAAKFGVGATNQAFAKAYADFFRGGRNAHGDISIEGNLTGEEARALYRVRRAGIIDKTLAHDTSELSNDPAALMSARRSLRKIMAGMFHHAERMNREVTYMAAFRLARASGMDFDAAAGYAESILHKTHFDYTQWNRARLMRGNWARVITQFKQYSLGTTWLLGRNFLFTVREMLAAAKGEQSVRDAFRSEAYKTLAGILGMQLMFAGALGLPIGGIVMAINALGGAFGDDDDEPFDFEASFRVWAAETFGTEAGRALAKGVIPWALGQIPGLPEVDLQTKLSMADLWFRDPDRELEGNDAALYWLTQVLGPSAGAFAGAFAGAKLWADGHPERAVEKALPKALMDPLKAMRYHAEGVENLRGDKLIEDLGISEELAQALGLTPARVSERYAENRAIGNADGALAKRRQGLLDRLAQARMDRDGGAFREAWAEATAFSKKNPDRAIRGQDIGRSVKARMRRSAQTEAGIYLPKQRAGLREEYRFAPE